MEYLTNFLDTPQQRILDIGSANGYEALRLASKGHHLTILDKDKQFLEKAANLPWPSDRTPTVIHSKLEAWPSMSTFDVVLAHNSIAHMDDPATAIQLSCRRVRQNGIISIIGVNPQSDLLRIGYYSHPQPRNEPFPHPSTLFKKNIFRIPVQFLKQQLKTNQMKVKAEYGIRCFVDYLPNALLRNLEKNYSQLMQVEKLAGTLVAFRDTSRFYHLIATPDRKAL